MAPSIRASKQGLDLIDTARRKKGWTKTEQAWIGQVPTSESTLKRFWACNPIQRETFIAICETVGVNDRQAIADFEVQHTQAEKSNTKRKYISLTLNINFDELDHSKLNQIIAEFITLGGDQSINLMDIDDGSIKLIFSGSEKAIQNILNAYNNGELDAIADVEVSNIDYLSKQQLAELILKNSASYLDLRRADLTEVDLIGANLSDANLSRANLSEANLIGANLIGANLIGANLRRANLCETYLMLAHLSRADLRRVDLIEADLRAANLSRVDLSGANLRGADLSEANLIGANLSGANLRSTNLIGANLGETNLREANLSGADLSGADLRKTYLREANLSGADLSDADLREANLSGADLHEANLSRTDLREANLRIVNLNMANLSGAEFENAIFANNPGLTESGKNDMQKLGAIFQDSPDSDVPSIVRR